MGLDIRLGKTNWGFKGKNYLFLIAIDQYDYWSKLKCAKNDVEKFKTILTSKYQFEEADITYLSDTKASLRNILAGFRNFANKITKDDNLIIYFSGHGHYIPEIETGYWIPQNAHCDEDYEDEFINTVVIVDKLRAIKSLHTFLIVDACFSGALLAHKKGSITRTEQHKSRRVFTSGRHDELVNDGPEGGHSPFAESLLNVLIENTNRYISVSRLIVEIREKLKGNQSPQDGRINDDDGGDFVFHVKISEAEIWASLVKQNDKDAYKKFAEQFPNSAYREDAVEMYEWLTASETNTIKALTSYLEKYRGKGKHAPMAISALDALEEEKCWQKTKSKNTCSAYYQYIGQYPNGKYVKEAEEMIKKLCADEDEKGRERILPIGPTTPVNLEEEKAWSDAQKEDTFLAYQDFSQSFADSKHVSEAKLKMNTLDKMASDRIRIESASTIEIEKSPLSLKDKVNLLEKLIKTCKKYFQDYPAGRNNIQVKKIKDNSQIKLLNLLK